MQIKPEQFAETIDGWLKDYGDEGRDALNKAILEVAEESKQDLTGAGGFNGRKFKRSWIVKTTEGKFKGVFAQVGNKVYRITHLLEFGHATRGGGRARGFNFVAPVNDKVEERVMDKLKEALK
jgi:hypothetical protein